MKNLTPAFTHPSPQQCWIPWKDTRHGACKLLTSNPAKERLAATLAKKIPPSPNNTSCLKAWVAETSRSPSLKMKPQWVSVHQHSWVCLSENGQCPLLNIQQWRWWKSASELLDILRKPQNNQCQLTELFLSFGLGAQNLKYLMCLFWLVFWTRRSNSPLVHIFGFLTRFSLKRLISLNSYCPYSLWHFMSCSSKR